MEQQYKSLLENCNEDQLSVYHNILESVHRGEGGLFFVYGSGGCGKTYLCRTLICKLRSQDDIVLPVASSGIAATLLPGGRTAHSRFKIPIILDDLSLCGIAHNSDIAALIKQTKLIIWDEAPMQQRYAFECLDRSLRDIMKSVNPERAAMPFGGITMFLGGDFRQVLPVITNGDRGDIVSATITRSRLWSICKIFLLTKNMRLNNGATEIEKKELKQFAKWVLDVGDGKVVPTADELSRCVEDDIVIPAQFCDLNNVNSVENMIKTTYLDFLQNCQDPKYLSEREILTPTNQTVGHLNSLIVEMLPGEPVSYFSVDSAEDFGGTEDDLNSAFPIQYLNSINIPGMPSHELKLKSVRSFVDHSWEHIIFIPRMELCPSESRIPFKLVRKQMPLQICYEMTINKAQGQSLKTVGLFLPKSVFTHGQFCVAISRVTSPHGLKIFVDDEYGLPTNITQNVVYCEVFYALPRN